MRIYPLYIELQYIRRQTSKEPEERVVVVVVNMLFIYDLSNSPSSPSHANFPYKI